LSSFPDGFEGVWLRNVRGNAMLRLFLRGAALQRRDDRIVLNAA
jgi:hypothetical protein